MRFLDGKYRAIRQLVYTPDGSKLIARSENELIVWNLASGKELSKQHEPVRSPSSHSWALAVSRDSQFLAMSTPLSKVIHVLDAATLGQVSRSQSPDPTDIRHLAFSPQGRTLFVGSYRGGVISSLTCWNRATGTCQASYRICGYGIAVSPDGSLLASGTVDPGLCVWELGPAEDGLADNQATLLHFRGLQRLITALAFTPTGHRLVSIGDPFAAEPSEVVLWEVKTGREAERLPGPPGPIMAQAISPDGSVLAWADPQGMVVHLWDLFRGKTIDELDWGLGTCQAVAFSPDGLTAAAGGDTGRVVIWDLDLYRAR
jgi:WD40 repeat protein